MTLPHRPAGPGFGPPLRDRTGPPPRFRTASAEDVRAALADLAGLGGFFPVPAAGEEPAGTGEEAGWRPLAGLREPAYLDGRVEATRRVFAGRTGIAPEEVPPRIAASVLHLGIAERLLSPAIGAAVLHGVVPDPGAWRWRPAPRGPLPLLAGGGGAAVPDPQADPAGAAEALAAGYLDGLVEPVSRAVASRVAVSPRVLRGNAASAFAGAVRHLSEARPEAAPGASALLRAVLSRRPLNGAGRLDGSGRFTRRSCCLYYRLPDGGKCGDCILLRSGESSR
ncbi:(2Fe-2S)-binding protein [Nocardiopsis sp. CNT-189]|uniref:(2Fe-2S)-binding protein n=1 Tax=Nocardiopsis oceanisediminis TaxID=2816862 RepID=UPI003B39E2AD